MELSELEAEEGVVRWNFFVDGSMGQMDPSYSGNPGAYSLVYRNPEDGRWVEQAWFLENMFNNNWGELMAIAEALNMVTLRLRLEPTVTTPVIHIFNDSKISLDYLERKTGSTRVLFDLVMGPLRSYIKALSLELHRRGAWLGLSHIPGHKHDVDGHARADKAARTKYLEGKKTLDDMRNGRR
jgi:ribonuclease HI